MADMARISEFVLHFVMCVTMTVSPNQIIIIIIIIILFQGSVNAKSPEN